MHEIPIIQNGLSWKFGGQLLENIYSLDSIYHWPLRKSPEDSLIITVSAPKGWTRKLESYWEGTTNKPWQTGILEIPTFMSKLIKEFCKKDREMQKFLEEIILKETTEVYRNISNKSEDMIKASVLALGEKLSQHIIHFYFDHQRGLRIQSLPTEKIIWGYGNDYLNLKIDVEKIRENLHEHLIPGKDLYTVCGYLCSHIETGYTGVMGFDSSDTTAIGISTAVEPPSKLPSGAFLFKNFGDKYERGVPESVEEVLELQKREGWTSPMVAPKAIEIARDYKRKIFLKNMKDPWGPSLEWPTDQISEIAEAAHHVEAA